MHKPFVVVYVTSSLDGRISLFPGMTLSNSSQFPKLPAAYDNLFGDWKAFSDQITQIYKPDTYLEGSNMVMYESQEVKALPEYSGDTKPLFTDYLPEEIVKRPTRNKWLAIVDGKGRIRDGYKGDSDDPAAYILHLVSESVAPEYLAFLRKETIPYLVAGKKRVDLAKILDKMYRLLGVRTVAISSGGKLCGALLRQNLIDEVNILFNPFIIGGFSTPTLFNSPDIKPPQILPARLDLVSVQTFKNGSFWVRYEVKKG
jgi:2,5-diamino-6-(ribosylamino)-4(3H)-pyrimidinone 5'-phosphate reductase